jgi:predicted TIM-barrel fold metal-dependent hydrolase
VRLPDIPPPLEPVRRPELRLPAGATDCQAHVFGPQARYPLLPDTHFVPHESWWDGYARMLRSIGCERAVLVQPSVYGTDNAAIEDSLAAPHGIDLRAIAVVAPDVADAELLRLHDLGFRGIRLNLAAATKGLRQEHARPLANRIRHLGWHLQVYADFHRQPEIGEVLAALPVPVVIDHFGRVQADDGLDSPVARAMLRTLAHDNCWAKLSAPYFVSHRFPHYDDIVPLAQAMLARAPDRLVWGTDWPHASARERMPADADLADMLGSWLPDHAARQRVLADNPARLYGFAGT